MVVLKAAHLVAPMVVCLVGLKVDVMVLNSVGLWAGQTDMSLVAESVDHLVEQKVVQ